MVKVKEDLTGRKFGKLVVLERIEDYQEPNGRSRDQWLCRCECGNLTRRTAKSLKQSKNPSCKTCQHPRKDLTGQRFGRLVVINRAPDYCLPSNQTVKRWECQCDCGQRTIVAQHSLLCGDTVSCGCYAEERRLCLAQQRIGLKCINNQGEMMEIVNYRSARDFDVEFLTTKHIKKHCTSIDAFLRGAILDPYLSTVAEVGYLGGLSNCTTQDTYIRPYSIWRGIIDRAFNDEFKQRVATYQNCTMDNNWLNFENFAQWYIDNLYNCGNEIMCIDKDILIKGNKHYGPETCLIVPSEINVLFVKCDKKRGIYPIGVSKHPELNKFRARMAKYGKEVHLGCFDTPEEAFQAYKKAKEQHIKDVADEYKAKYPDFPQKLYDAMYAYEVEITD